jgi:hypothetical protein
LKSETAKSFVEDPFVFVDNLSLNFKGINFNIFQKVHAVQRIALFGSLICLTAWVVFGFDSTPLQFIHVLYEGIPALISGESVDLFGIYSSYYGKEMHYSAFVIYGLLYYFMSKNFEGAGIKGTKNMIYSFAVMFFSISVFEWFWIICFATFQNQPWCFTWSFPQLKILVQNTGFFVAGCLTALYMFTDRFFWDLKTNEAIGRRFFFNWKSLKLWSIIGLTVAGSLLWIYYPFHVDSLTVTLENGNLWSNSNLFPQTLYTIDLNPTDSVYAGEWFWIENNLIHGINTLVKILFTLSFYYLFRMKKIEKKDCY